MVQLSNYPSLIVEGHKRQLKCTVGMVVVMKAMYKRINKGGY